MKKEIQTFKHEQFGEIRTMVDEKGEPWFVGKDVARRLGYINPEKALRVHVDDEDKGVNEMGTPGGTQKVTFINESGLYSRTRTDGNSQTSKSCAAPWRSCRRASSRRSS